MKTKKINLNDLQKVEGGDAICFAVAEKENGWKMYWCSVWKNGVLVQYTKYSMT